MAEALATVALIGDAGAVNILMNPFGGTAAATAARGSRAIHRRVRLGLVLDSVVGAATAASVAAGLAATARRHVVWFLEGFGKL